MEANTALSDAERLRELYSYDPDTGYFTRLISLSNRVKVGSRAGSKSSFGYLMMTFEGAKHCAHRLAWLYVHGNWPCADIDHINGVRDDNRIVNLRDVSRGENLQNLREAKKSSQHGYLGVSANNSGWQAQIWLNRQRRYLGNFKTPELAHAAYIEAKRAIHPFGNL